MANYHDKRDKSGRWAKGSGPKVQTDRKVKLTRKEKTELYQSTGVSYTASPVNYDKISSVFTDNVQARTRRTVTTSRAGQRQARKAKAAVAYRRPTDKKLRFGVTETYHAGTKNTLESLKVTLVSPVVEENKKTGATRQAPFDVRKARSETKATAALVAAYQPSLHSGTPDVYSPTTRELAESLMSKDPKDYFVKNPSTGGSHRLAPDTAAFLSSVNKDLAAFSDKVRSRTYA